MALIFFFILLPIAARATVNAIGGANPNLGNLICEYAKLVAMFGMALFIFLLYLSGDSRGGIGLLVLPAFIMFMGVVAGKPRF